MRDGAGALSVYANVAKLHDAWSLLPSDLRGVDIARLPAELLTAGGESAPDIDRNRRREFEQLEQQYS